MAPKRKLDSSASTVSEPPKKQPQQKPNAEEDSDEYEEVEEEVEVYEEVEEEEEEEEEEQDPEDSDDEPIQNLLEPFPKEQLASLLLEAAQSHRDVADRIRKIADADPVHRKIFVHGLGWDTTADTLRAAFAEFGDIEDCRSVTDKASGKSKGYGFILFRSRAAARRALVQPQKRIGNRMTACQLASVGPTGPIPAPAQAQQPRSEPVSEYTQRKIYVSNVGAEIDPQRLLGFFSKFGEIEEGPLGLDKATGKPRGFCLFVYKTAEGARRALEEQHKNFNGHTLHCQRAIDGPKLGKFQHQHGYQNQSRAEVSGFNQAAVAAPQAQAVFNPALGQALTALLASQGAGLGLGNLLGSLGSGVVAGPGGYGGQQQAGVSGVGGGYGNQGGIHGGYSSQQMGINQGGAGRGQGGNGQYNGGPTYMGQ